MLIKRYQPSYSKLVAIGSVSLGISVGLHRLLNLGRLVSIGSAITSTGLSACVIDYTRRRKRNPIKTFIPSIVQRARKRAPDCEVFLWTAPPYECRIVKAGSQEYQDQCDEMIAVANGAPLTKKVVQTLALLLLEKDGSLLVGERGKVTGAAVCRQRQYPYLIVELDADDKNHIVSVQDLSTKLTTL